jgi:stage III sporulation protein SpoIIIAA
LKQQRITDNLGQLLEVLPPAVRDPLERLSPLDDLLEIVMDLGRVAEARFPGRVVELGTTFVGDYELQYVVERIGVFGKDNRAGIERTLHRISAIRNRVGKIIGLTCRIGRAVYGTIDIIQDVVESGKSILLLGRPGMGKTTKLREVARVLSIEARKRVVIVDTSNEIAGDGDIPHPAIGLARRMQVAEPSLQHAVMIEAVENHMPEVVVIDEIGVEAEAFAARTIAERGVQLIGTAHGNSLENLLMNPTLCDLVGGIQAVTLSDDEARRRGTQKTVLERKAPPTFDVVIEIMDVDKLAIHHDVGETVDRMLRGQRARPEIRIRNAYGEIEIVQRDAGPSAPALPSTQKGRSWSEDAEPLDPSDDEMEADEEPEPRRRERPRSTRSGARTVRVFPYGVNRSRLDRAILEGGHPAVITRDIQEADIVIALKASYRREPLRMREGAARNLPTYIVKSNTYAQIAGAMRDAFQSDALDRGDVQAALREAEEAAKRVKESGEPAELRPQNSYVRRLQHQMIEKLDLLSESVGTEPKRRVRILADV